MKVDKSQALGFGYHTPAKFWLCAALRWREEARSAGTQDIRAMMRSYMREAALAWKRRALVGL